MPELPPILTADSITRVGPEAMGAVVVNGSHGGIYAAYVAAKLRVGAAIFNDAGVGRDNAGIAGLDYLEALGVPAAVVGHDTARIGDGSEILAVCPVAPLRLAADRLGRPRSRLEMGVVGVAAEGFATLRLAQEARLAIGRVAAPTAPFNLASFS